MDRRQSEALDRWLTTDPRDSQSECPECGGCEWVEVDCHDGGAWECHVGWVRDGEYEHGIRACLPAYYRLYHDPEPEIDDACHCGHPECGAC